MLKKPIFWKILGYILLLLGAILGASLGAVSAPIKGALAAVAFAILGNLQIEKSKNLERELTIKSRLDEEALEALVKLNGLMFTREEIKRKFDIDISIQTIRYLIQQDIIKNEVFSLSQNGKISYGYYLTDFGKDVLRKHIGIIDLFPDIMIDMYKTAYWLGHKKDFSAKKQGFKKMQKKDFDDFIKSFFEYIPKEFTKLENDVSHEDKIGIFRKFLEDQKISYSDKMTIIDKWKV
ncbi:MAG: hypothetical protein P9M13_01490 [Candidatus Ancaeobacter aquaticus]|nr:hypothetical protein [Candidatus Ancaeobacter aquaticus]